jgi:hypothetical protein
VYSGVYNAVPGKSFLIEGVYPSVTTSIEDVYKQKDGTYYLLWDPSRSMMTVITDTKYKDGEVTSLVAGRTAYFKGTFIQDTLGEGPVSQKWSYTA